jgi:DNA-binding response OmpR family regulator
MVGGMSGRHRILIVEDDADLRLMYRTALAMAGFDVQEAGDGLDGLRIIDRDPPDAMILDLGLPRIDGAAVRSEIAAQAHTRHIPVIVVTGLPGDHTALNVPCVLRKPVSPDEVVNAVRDCLAARGGTASR